ncbi:hypothetical protein JTB14_031463 [Gonioctena quinquepunctata]|nr:hypothetical protein JTB14_031463 [Gonioctena quinquepunctata]
MEKIKNVEDFKKYIGEGYNTIEYDSILGKIEDPKLRVKIKNIEHLYRAIRLENVFRMYWDSIQADTYIPNINIDEYDIELAEADTILRKKDSKLWKKFSKMGKKYCDEHQIRDIAKKEEEKGIYLRLAEQDRQRYIEIRKTQSIEKQKTNPEDIRKDGNMDTTSSHENVERSKPEALYVRLERLDKEDLKKREELWEKEILEDNLREKKKKEEKLNKQKQKDIINKGKAQRKNGMNNRNQKKEEVLSHRKMTTWKMSTSTT